MTRTLTACFITALLGILALLPRTPTADAAPLPQATPTSVATPVATPPPVTQPLRDGVINLEHLQRLTEIVEWNDTPMALVHIYSEAPEYEWVDASGEGIAAVDDVARAALVYLMYYERTGDEQALDLARASLNFTLALQDESGEYYNFVYDRDGAINTDGITSYRSWNWWAARGQWALAMGYRVFRDVDPAYAEALHEAYLRGEDALREQMGAVGAYDELHGERVPAWLLHNGSDLSALAVIGLAEYYAVEPNPQTRQLITNLANGVAKYQLGAPGEFPFDAHPSTSTSLALWHAWGSHQVHALAVAGSLLERDDWIRSAQRTADHFFMRLLATDFINEMAPLPQRRGQIAYGTQVITAGLWSLYQATGDEQYARAAGLAASWLFGNNMAGVPMYDPDTGRAFDGIDGPTAYRVNRNAGAESTIEALYTLLLIGDDPIATEYLRVTPVETPFRGDRGDGKRRAGGGRRALRAARVDGRGALLQRPLLRPQRGRRRLDHAQPVQRRRLSALRRPPASRRAGAGARGRSRARAGRGGHRWRAKRVDCRPAAADRHARAAFARRIGLARRGGRELHPALDVGRREPLRRRRRARPGPRAARNRPLRLARRRDLALPRHARLRSPP